MTAGCYREVCKRPIRTQMLQLKGTMYVAQSAFLKLYTCTREVEAIETSPCFVLCGTVETLPSMQAVPGLATTADSPFSRGLADSASMHIASTQLVWSFYPGRDCGISCTRLALSLSLSAYFLGVQRLLLAIIVHGERRIV